MPAQTGGVCDTTERISIPLGWQLIHGEYVKTHADADTPDDDVHERDTSGVPTQLDGIRDITERVSRPTDEQLLHGV